MDHTKIRKLELEAMRDSTEAQIRAEKMSTGVMQAGLVWINHEIAKFPKDKIEKEEKTVRDTT